MLKINHIHKAFGDNQVLKGVSLEVDKGDVVCIIGPSGSGKTTLLRCINFLESADQGTMQFNDKTLDLHKKSGRSASIPASSSKITICSGIRRPWKTSQKG